MRPHTVFLLWSNNHPYHNYTDASSTPLYATSHEIYPSSDLDYLSLSSPFSFTSSRCPNSSGTGIPDRIHIYISRFAGQIKQISLVPENPHTHEDAFALRFPLFKFGVIWRSDTIRYSNARFVNIFDMNRQWDTSTLSF